MQSGTSAKIDFCCTPPISGNPGNGRGSNLSARSEIVRYRPFRNDNDFVEFPRGGFAAQSKIRPDPGPTSRVFHCDGVRFHCQLLSRNSAGHIVSDHSDQIITRGGQFKDSIQLERVWHYFTGCEIYRLCLRIHKQQPCLTVFRQRYFYAFWLQNLEICRSKRQAKNNLARLISGVFEADHECNLLADCVILFIGPDAELPPFNRLTAAR